MADEILDSVTLGELNRNLNRLTSLVERQLAELEKNKVPREVYEIDRHNFAIRFEQVEMDVQAIVKQHEDDLKERRQYRWAAIAAMIPVIVALITVLAGGHF